jgi:uncharacterized Tic20 family protein
MQAHPASVERNWAMAAHLSALVAVAGMPFGHVLGPLVVYLVKGHESDFVASHAKASLNYQITISILGFVAIILAIAGWFWFVFNAAVDQLPHHLRAYPILLCWLALVAAIVLILLLSIVFIIMGTMAASNGQTYKYPFAFTFLR